MNEKMIPDDSIFPESELNNPVPHPVLQDEDAVSELYTQQDTAGHAPDFATAEQSMEDFMLLQELSSEPVSPTVSDEPTLLDVSSDAYSRASVSDSDLTAEDEATLNSVVEEYVPVAVPYEPSLLCVSADAHSLPSVNDSDLTAEDEATLNSVVEEYVPIAVPDEPSLLDLSAEANLSESAAAASGNDNTAEDESVLNDILTNSVLAATEDLLPQDTEGLSSPEEISEEEVTDIILETLAEQALENKGTAGEITDSNSVDNAPTIVLPDTGTLSDAEEEDAEQSGDDEAAEAPSPAAPAKKERPVRKGRPKRKSGSGLLSIPHLISAAIWLLIITAIGVTLGRTIWVCAADVLAFGRESKEVTISVTADDTMETITEKLHEAGLIDIPQLFLLYADLTDVEEEHKITTGTFTLNTIYDYMAIVSHMGPRATNRVVVEDVLIPEGYNCRQIFALLEEKGICKAADLEAYAANGELDDYWFLEGVERGDKYCLEGFLFPDTYDFYENSTPKLALEKMLDGFQYRFNAELREQLPVLNERLTEMMRANGDSEEFIAENQFTLRDLLTVASLIEEETANTSESYRIASVIYNRLFNWGSTPRFLNIDATIIYALGGKTDLTAEDMAVDSPYNTYTNTGLTPGPISNPGIASIQAALNPEETAFYYYVLNPATGEHQFSKTYAEHSEWVEAFREAQNNG